MRNLSDTIARLKTLRSHDVGASQAYDSRLVELGAFGSNPGALRAYTYSPDKLPAHAALVVVLHGCTQTAAGYDAGAGWSEMADRYGFAVLFPEQQRVNNAHLCFNWFSPEDNRRGAGEALSIRQMVAAVSARDRIDPARVFVTGLSAGGAMTAVMLATYPEVFRGGAIIAGLPYGCANSVAEAFDRMRGHGLPAGPALAAPVRAASSHHGPWPTVSVWHGSADATVSPANAQAIVDQWRSLHGVGGRASSVETFDGHRRRAWRDDTGREVIEEIVVAGMGHGTPIDTREPDGCGRSGPFMLEAGISSTRGICRFWKLSENQDTAAQDRHSTSRDLAPSSELAAERPTPVFKAHVRSRPREEPSMATGVGKVIEDALRTAGLLR